MPKERLTAGRQGPKMPETSYRAYSSMLYPLQRGCPKLIVEGADRIEVIKMLAGGNDKRKQLHKITEKQRVLHDFGLGHARTHVVDKYGGIEIQLETTLSDRGRNAQFNIGGCELPLAKFHDPLGVGEHGRIPRLSSHHNLPEQNQIDIALGLLLCMMNYGVVKRADVEILPTTLLAVMLSSLLKLTPSGFRDKMIRGSKLTGILHGNSLE
ncbi:hypothetical protein F4774DRAFT_412084 [Daldinia eschscholtzii]|nr:hypothetical protein F4774DRAFT_412084 [Daldinia eschscholtzii]